MFTLLWIIGLGIIAWPVISGPLASLFNGIVFIVSVPIYWTMRILKRPKNVEEMNEISSTAVTIAFVTVIVTPLILMIIKSL